MYTVELPSPDAQTSGRRWTAGRSGPGSGAPWP